MRKSDTKTYSLSDLQAKVAAGDFVPMTGSAETGEKLDAAFWDKAQVVMPTEHPKVGISLRVDSEVYEWFKGTGKGYLSRMNAVLKAYVDTQGNPRRK
ncbi:MAG: BrnA antitoxin family protein [Rickettsiales bacterium]